MSLYGLGGVYFVQDGHHRVSVARFHGAEWIDAEVAEFWAPKAQGTVRPYGERPIGAVAALVV